MEHEQAIQEEQYIFPYHYIPQADTIGFSQHLYWSWGLRYLGGLRVARDLCEEEPFSSLIDIGCGDGRFLREVHVAHPDADLLGIDYSARAISLARGFNPDISYLNMDITEEDVPAKQADVVSMIEVLEHIPPETVPRFLEASVALLRPAGRLVLTVPHVNKALNPKHYQHFSSETLISILSPYLEVSRIIPFDFDSIWLRFLGRLLGRSGRYYLVTWQPLLNAFHRYYMDRCLYRGSESECFRIACVARKPG